MNKLRQAIFGVVDALEERMLGLVEVVDEAAVRFVETVVGSVQRLTLSLFDLGFDFVEAVIEEGFNLFRAALAVVLGAPDTEKSLDEIMDERMQTYGEELTADDLPDYFAGAEARAKAKEDN